MLMIASGNLHTLNVEQLLAAEPVQVMGFNSCPDDRVRLAVVRSDLERGILPSIGHLSLVVDANNYGRTFIPATQYAGHFDKGHAPITPVGHDLYHHDSEHVLGYRASFASLLFARVVVGAARNSLQTDQPAVFTQEIDGMQDNVLDIIEGLATNEIFEEAKVSLQGLLQLYPDKAGGNDLREALHARLCYELGLKVPPQLRS